jgi:hypothetical protein
LQVHFDRQTIEWLKQQEIDVAFFPKGGAGELFVMDNSLFCDYKRDFAQELKELPTYPCFSRDEKVDVAKQVWNEFSSYHITLY